MAEWIWSNGTLIAADELRVSPLDRGLTVGLGLFETMLALDGRPVFLDRHLARHAAGCARLGWHELDPDWVGKGVREVLKANQLTRGAARVRLFQTAGQGSLGDPSQGPAALSLITAATLPDSPESLSLTFSPWVRNERSPLAGLKCASYAENLLALEQALAKGFDEPLFLNTAGDVCETATANVFMVKSGTLLTPPTSSGCLPGITRAVVLELAAQHGIPLSEAPLSPEDLVSADELFLTSSLRGITPVTRFDQRHFPSGPVTVRMRQLLMAVS